MQEKLTIARPYAAAAFDFAAEHDQVDAWSEMLGALALTVSDAALEGYIGHPQVTDEQLLGLLDDVLGDRLNDAGRNFVRALIEAERLELAPQIAELFERRKAEAAGVVNVEVTAAYALSDAEQQKIDAAVRARLGRNCRVESRVDSALIGGAVIKIGDSVIDLSLRGRLDALAQQIA